MRMRRKKNLETHLDECGVYFTELHESTLDTREKSESFLNLDELFGRTAPLLLEIGCGKGGFAAKLAKRYPEFNILAVEKSKNVLLSACKDAMADEIPNLRFLCGGAEYLARHIKPHTVERIYLNFSCPFPKARHASRRLTAPAFLDVYKQLLSKDAQIHQKTDHPRFFEFSIENLTKAGFKLQNVSLDLHNSDFEGNIMTEYESRFVELGKPIYRLEAYL